MNEEAADASAYRELILTGNVVDLAVAMAIGVVFGVVLFVVVVAIALFAFIPRVNVAVDLVIRLALVVPVASISYEVLKVGAAHESNPIFRALVVPGLLLQKITTRRPDRGMIEVAVASLEEAVAGDAEVAA